MWTWLQVSLNGLKLSRLIEARHSTWPRPVPFGTSGSSTWMSWSDISSPPVSGRPFRR